MMKIKKIYLLIILIQILLFFIFSCASKKEKLEDILDEYINFYNIKQGKNYITLHTNKWTDSTTITVIQYWVNNIDTLILPLNTLKCSYKEVNIYFTSSSNTPLIPNKLHFEKMAPTKKYEGGAYSEYFNDIQIVFYPKNNCILKLLETTNSKDFNILFKEKGLMCE